jgi:hypothetical protein
MQRDLRHAGNIVLLRGACLWLLAALALAWCLVGLSFDIPLVKALLPGKFARVRQAHIDLLLMTALILGIYAAKTPLPWHVRWAMVVGAFTNSSLFLLPAIFPILDGPEPAPGLAGQAYFFYLIASIVTTSYGFGKAAVTVLRSTLEPASGE